MRILTPSDHLKGQTITIVSETGLQCFQQNSFAPFLSFHRPNATTFVLQITYMPKRKADGTETEP